MALRGERKPEAITRRRVLSLLGLSGALGLAAPSLWPTISAAEAPAIPRAYNQVDKPLPGESGAARTGPQLDKPIPAEGTGTRARKYRRKQVRQQRVPRHKRRRVQAEPQQPQPQPQPQPWLPASPEYRPR